MLFSLVPTLQRFEGGSAAVSVFLLTYLYYDAFFTNCTEAAKIEASMDHEAYFWQYEQLMQLSFLPINGPTSHELYLLNSFSGGRITW